MNEWGMGSSDVQLMGSGDQCALSVLLYSPEVHVCLVIEAVARADAVDVEKRHILQFPREGTNSLRLRR